MSSRVALFAYGSLVAPASAAQTLGHPVELATLARLRGWRRRWSTVRDNLACEKTFARAGDGLTPPWCLGLNLERAAEAAEEQGPNGALLAVGEADLERLDLRELRYDRADVTAAVEVTDAAGEPTGDAVEFDHVVAYVAKGGHHAPSPPPGAVILSPYVAAVEAAFATLGERQLDLFRATTGAHPVELIDPVLVRDQIPVGNPREW